MKKISLIRKLRLRPGDIVVVSDYETATRISRVSTALPKGITSVPIVVAPEGIRKVSLARLKAIVAKLEAKQ